MTTIVNGKDVLEILFHAASFTAPDLALGKSVATNANNWTLGVSSPTIFDVADRVITIHKIKLSQIDEAGEFQINLYSSKYMGGTVPVCSAPFHSLNKDGSSELDVYTPLLHGGLITAKVAGTKSGMSCLVKIKYRFQ